MKKGFTFYLKTGMLILGFLLLTISAILPITIIRMADYSKGYLQYKTILQTAGHQSYLWYAMIAASLIIFAIGYFYNNTVNIVLVFVFAPLFAFGILFLTFLATFSLSFGGPSPKTGIADGYLLSVLGSLLIVVATAISVLRKKAVRPPAIDLLDDI